jgi:hypothetical protein
LYRSDPHLAKGAIRFLNGLFYVRKVAFKLKIMAFLPARVPKFQGLVSVRPLLLLLFLVVWVPCGVWADSAAVLPAGVSRVYVDYYGYLPVTERYNPDGERESLTYPFNPGALDSDVFSSLKPLDPFVGGTATLGDVNVAFEYDIDVVDIGYQYGITDKLTAGLHIPYYWIRNNVSTAFNSESANVGLNPATGTCCIPIAAGGVPFTDEDVQNLVTSEFGFNRVETWSGEGIGDIELGAKYRFLRTDKSALAVSGGLRIPTGHADDPDDLTDVAWSFGNYALLFRLHYDYELSSLWKPPRGKIREVIPEAGDFIVNGTFRYDLMLPDSKVKRIGDTPDQIFTNNREKVSRDLGDRFAFEVSGKYQITNAIAIIGLYRYGFKLKDRISGNMGFNYESLEANTDSSEHVYVIEARYSTLAAYERKKFPVPMVFSVAYRERFMGRGPRNGQANQVLYTRWLQAGLRVFF